MNIFEREYKFETHPKVELKIVEPESDKSWMITFDVKKEDEVAVYNYVISEILKREDLCGFHQIGIQNDPGFHGWEIWNKSKVNKEILNNLKDEITGLIEKELANNR